MKGFDLYVWEKDGKMFFTLLPGTNRMKTSEEIYDPKNSVEGMSAIENKIDEIDSGEYIFLKTIRTDTNDLKPLIDYMKSKKLKITVIPESHASSPNPAFSGNLN
ncbi:MAG TPA: hypothetical protein VMZ03_08545 [Chitinophagaceae bacterium]|nr:hypothetical protein [Chitinophagaceae bacterium]